MKTRMMEVMAMYSPKPLNPKPNLKTKSKLSRDKQLTLLNRHVLSAVSLMKASTKTLWTFTIGGSVPCWSLAGNAIKS